MNFFAQQDRAKRNTFWLVFLLICAVICLIAMTVVTVAAALYFAQQPTDSPTLAANMHLSWWQSLQHVLASDVVFYAAGAVLLVVTCGSLFKLLQLGGSGRKVAEALGGRPIPSSSNDPDERKVLNVVEEMAIASGNPVPAVYLLDDHSINAFAAGTDRRNAVIGVTRGCIQLLSRDELQGVIAHEFSHIHNGDMRINLRLVALLHGILIIGLIGSFLLRSSAFGSRNKNRGAQIGLGLAFLILGYCGIFFGNIIKAAVSRQREFLADASAVQFTRNPEGISNALKKIGGLSEHALLKSPVATEYSHLYFGQGVKTAFNGLMATHPPLEVRIRKIEPRWNGQFILPQPSTEQPAYGPSTTHSDERRSGFAGAETYVAQNIERAIDTIGNPTEVNLEAAEVLIQALPKALYEATHDPFLARALIYCLLLDRESSHCEQEQIDYLRGNAHPVTFKAFTSLMKQVKTLPREQYLPLIDLSLPALRSQSESQSKVFKKNLVALIKADQQVSLFEWCLYRIITLSIEGESRTGGQRSIKDSKAAIEVVLAAACFSGKTADYRGAFKAAEQRMPGLTLTPSSGSDVSFQQLDKAILTLSELKALEKPQFLKGLAACIEADAIVTTEETELFRAIADCLNCPVPLITLTGDERR